MRIFDVENDAALKSVRLYLTRPEASELRDSLSDMLEGNEPDSHEHVMDEEYKREVTVFVYDPAILERFTEREALLLTKDRQASERLFQLHQGMKNEFW